MHFSYRAWKVSSADVISCCLSGPYYQHISKTKARRWARLAIFVQSLPLFCILFRAMTFIQSKNIIRVYLHRVLEVAISFDYILYEQALG